MCTYSTGLYPIYSTGGSFEVWFQLDINYVYIMYMYGGHSILRSNLKLHEVLWLHGSTHTC